MVDREIFTYLKNQKYLILIINKKFKIFHFQMGQDTVLQLMEPFRVTINRFNRLIVQNNPLGIDDPFTEKPVALLAQAEAENVPEPNFIYADTFLIISFFSRCYSHFFCYSNSITWFLHQQISKCVGFFQCKYVFQL